jgi:hypothetical protein
LSIREILPIKAGATIYSVRCSGKADGAPVERSRSVRIAGD